MTTVPVMQLPSLLVRLAKAAQVNLDNGYQWVPASRLTNTYHPTVEVELPLLITGIETREQLMQLTKTLVNAYPPSHPVTVMSALSAAAQPMTSSLVEIGQMEVVAAESSADSFVLCLPPLPEGSSVAALQAVVAHLRSPEGCPWDQKQTLASMRHDLLDECVEVMEAIDLDLTGVDNSEHIAEELGDLFMAGILTLQIAIDEGRFQLADAMQTVVAKLIRRHPHVFGDTQVDGVDTVLANWDTIKAEEKRAKGQVVNHPLDGVPTGLPALEKARTLQSKAQKAALLDRATVAASLETQLEQLRQAQQADMLTEVQFGTLLWALVAVATEAGINAEDALRSYCVRFRNNS